MFSTKNLIVRTLGENDIEDFYQLNSNPEVMRYIRPVKDRESSAAFLLENIQLYQDFPLGRFHVSSTETGAFVGLFSVLKMSDRDALHVGYALMPWAQGKGWAKEVLQAGLQWLIKHSKEKEFYAITEPANLASAAVLKKSGFNWLENTVDRGKTLDVYVIHRGYLEA